MSDRKSSEAEEGTPEPDATLAAAIELVRNAAKRVQPKLDWMRAFALLDQTPDCIFVKDAEMRFVLANRAFRDTFCPEVDPIGLRAEDFLPQHIVRQSLISDQKLRDGTPRLTVAHRGLHSSTNFVTFKCRLSADDGKLAGIFSVTHQLTDNRSRFGFCDADFVRFEEMIEQLTENELVTLRLVSEGVMNKQIATRTDVSIRTVETRRKSLMKKLQVNSTAELVRLCVRLEDSGLLD